jgi:hypothetical protein
VTGHERGKQSPLEDGSELGKLVQGAGLAPAQVSASKSGVRRLRRPSRLFAGATGPGR